MIHLYMGTGKGKTTAALGLGLRAVGAGLQVVMIQFMKGIQSNESKAIKKLPNFSLTTFGRNVFLTEKSHEPIDETLAEKGLMFAKEILKQKKCDILILDEITIAVAFQLLKKEDVLSFIRKKPDEITIVLTGRLADKDFISIADLVTNFKEIKHPYQKKAKPQPGIEY